MLNFPEPKKGNISQVTYYKIRQYIRLYFFYALKTRIDTYTIKTSTDDVGVFNPLSRRYPKQNLEIYYEINEKEKKKLYDEMIQNVGYRSFISIFMSANGGFWTECKHFSAILSWIITEKRDEHNSILAGWVRPINSIIYVYVEAEQLRTKKFNMSLLSESVCISMPEEVKHSTAFTYIYTLKNRYFMN